MKYVIVQIKQDFIARSLALVTKLSLILGVSAEVNSISGMSYLTAVRECLPGTIFLEHKQNLRE